MAEMVTLSFEDIETDTENALLVNFGDSHTVWVPRSVCANWLHSDTIEIAEWFVINEELDGYVV